jgi:hypothetical protein
MSNEKQLKQLMIPPISTETNRRKLRRKKLVVLNGSK